MDVYLLHRWNDPVSPDDLIYVLGDFMLGRTAYCRELLVKLNGTKILIHGNHDRGHRAMESYGFHACLESAVLKLDGMKIQLQHRPMYGPLPEGMHGVMHGHIHRGDPADMHNAGECAYVPPYNVNLCVELCQYAPLSFKSAIKRLRSQLKESY